MATDITQFNSIKDVPKESILHRSKDGKTLVLVDGTKVSDKLIDDAKAKPRTKKDSAPTPLTTGRELLNDPEFVAGVRAVAEEAAQRVYEANQKPK
jgi:hypothetical protein